MHYKALQPQLKHLYKFRQPVNKGRSGILQRQSVCTNVNEK